MKKINCIILDDEPFAVKLMADYASKVPRLNVLYADSDVFKAIEILNTEVVDLVFIDIQMPQLTGIELMQMFNQKHNFIITSAYPDYALDVFQFHVIDYCLPVIYGACSAGTLREARIGGWPARHFKICQYLTMIELGPQ